MHPQFPLDYALDSGTQVTVQKAGENRYDFTLAPPDESPRHFTYVDGERTKAEWDEVADFEQLEALRRFWLEMEDVV